MSERRSYGLITIVMTLVVQLHNDKFCTMINVNYDIVQCTIKMLLFKLDIVINVTFNFVMRESNRLISPSTDIDIGGRRISDSDMCSSV